MTRRSLAMAALLALLTATPALAKGTDGVVLSGGGQEITISWEAQHAGSDLETLVRATHLYDVDWWQGNGGTRPLGDLGPVVVATWNFPAPVGTVIVQHLYPFAAAGPVAHVPAGQDYLGEPISGAWHPLAPNILESLRTVGFDTEALLSAPSSGFHPVFETLGWVGVLGALLALAAIMRGKRVRQAV